MSHVFRPRFVYGVVGFETDWSMSLPSRPWEYERPTVGGSRTAAAHVPASHVVRTDYNLVLPIRFRETEWLDLDALLAWGQLSETLVYYPDAGATVISAGYTCYLEAPLAGERFQPVRDAEYGRVREATLVLRKADGTPWDLEYFPANP